MFDRIMDNIAQIVGLILVVFVVVVLIPGILIFFFGAMFLMIILFAVLTAVGVPIEIKKDGEVIGHVVRFKFTPVNKNG